MKGLLGLWASLGEKEMSPTNKLTILLEPFQSLFDCAETKKRGKEGVVFGCLFTSAKDKYRCYDNYDGNHCYADGNVRRCWHGAGGLGCLTG